MLGTDGRYSVKNGNFCLFRKANISFAKFNFWESIFQNVMWITSVASSAFVAFEELVLRSLKALPLRKPFLTLGGWQEVKCVYWKASVGLKCARTSRMVSFLNLLPLYTHVSMRVISVPWILWSFWISYCGENLRKMTFHDLNQKIHESRIPQAINHATHAFRYSRITFLFK